MSKIALTCLNCSEEFHVFPSIIKTAIERGRKTKFCSRACTDDARSKGLILTKRRRGETLKCEACGTDFYRKQSMIDKRKSRFCSEPCRQSGFKLGLIDKTGPRPMNLRGEEIACIFCSKTVYRKLSMIVRRINKTCGDPMCVAAYGRKLWGLQPRPYVKDRAIRKRRATNFTAAQRAEWLGSKCAYCGCHENLTLDHVIPVCAGGQSTKENAQTLCGPCNNWKAKHVDRPLSRKQSPSGG